MIFATRTNRPSTPRLAQLELAREVVAVALVDLLVRLVRVFKQDFRRREAREPLRERDDVSLLLGLHHVDRRVLDGIEARIVEVERAEQHDPGRRPCRCGCLLCPQQRHGQQEEKQDAEPDAHCFTQVSVDLPIGMQPVVEPQSFMTERVFPSADSVAVEVANSFPFIRMMVFA